MAWLKEIVIDARHPAAQARFWAAALTAYEIRPYDAAEIARLAARGFTPETDPSVMLDGPGPSICFHVREVPREATNHVHLDIVGGPRAEEVARLEALSSKTWNPPTLAGRWLLVRNDREAVCYEIPAK